MTIEEAINYAENKIFRLKGNMERPGSLYGDYAIYSAELEFATHALAALSAQQKTKRFRAKLIARHNELLKKVMQDSDPYLSCLAGGISGVIRMLDEEEEHNEPLTLDELISTCKSHRTCSVCTKTDGLTYTSSPPMVRCTVDGKFHAPDSECCYDQIKETSSL